MSNQKEDVWNEDNRKINANWKLQTYDKIQGEQFKKIFEIKEGKKGSITGVGTEAELKNIVKIFIPDAKITSQKEAKAIINKILPAYSREPDVLLEKYKLIFEFDGPDHYNKPLNIFKDRIKYKDSRDFKIIRWPYYLELNRPTAEFIFGDMVRHFRKQIPNSNLPREGFYTNDKYEEAREKIYTNLFTGKGANKESEVTATGFTDSPYLPSQMCYEGLDILVNDFTWKCNCGCGASHPKINLDQFMWSLKLLEKDLKKQDYRWLVFPISEKGIPWHKNFMDLYEKTIQELGKGNSENLKYVFTRDKKSIRETIYD